MPVTKKLTVYLPVDVHEALTRLADTQWRDVPQQAAWPVVQAVRQWETREEALAVELGLDADVLEKKVVLTEGYMQRPYITGPID